MNPTCQTHADHEFEEIEATPTNLVETDGRVWMYIVYRCRKCHTEHADYELRQTAPKTPARPVAYAKPWTTRGWKLLYEKLHHQEDKSR